jgi:hypothetical protein
MNFQQYIADINAAIDDMRSDIWAVNRMPVQRTGIRKATDNFERIHSRQQKRAEIWSGIIAYRHEEIEFPELLMFLQSFDKTVTPDDVYTILGDSYHG